MPRYLVVANLTLGGEHLLATLRDRVADGAARIHVLVPASADPDTWHAHTEEEDMAAARERLARALEAYGQLGAEEVTGEVGALQPVPAVGDVLRREAETFDEIILSTLPPGPSRWLRLDLPARLRRGTDVPVTHVYSKDPAAA